MNENPIPLTFSPCYSAEKWNAISALLDNLAVELAERDSNGPAEPLAPVRTQSLPFAAST